MGISLDSIPLSAIVRIRDLMYKVDRPFRLDQGDVSFDAPESFKQGVREAHEAGKKLKAKGFHFDIAYTSALGRAQRACEQDLKMASLLGVDTDRTISLTFVMGAALAAVAGVMITMYYGVIDFFIGFLAGAGPL